MKNEAPSWSEAWATIYPSALRNIPEALNLLFFGVFLIV
jgi:hypothetical protein